MGKSKSNKIKHIYFFPLIIWILFMCFDGYYFVNRESSPIYWRAWEYVSNYTGLDSSVAPFKPLSVYQKTMTGDLMNAIEFYPRRDEILPQEFIVDEYGYRNRPGFLNKPIDALIIGSSFVAGGAETQENLLSEILTRDYGIRSYNYSTSVQYAYEDHRFKKTPPKYIIFVGTDGELISSRWKYMIEDREKPVNVPVKWNSYEDWKRSNEKFPQTFEKIAALAAQYSVLKYGAIQLKYITLNRIYTRSEIAKQTPQNAVSYDPSTKMLFWQKDYDNPLLGSPGKTAKDIELAVSTLKETDKKLSQRKIQFIVVPMLNKTLSELPKYRTVQPDETSIVALNNALNNANLHYIDMYDKVQKYRRDNPEPLYYYNDSHWSSKTNYFIAKQISEYIDNLEK